MIVAEARRWIGTPYRHQASCLGAGCDCLGLIIGVWQACVGPLPQDIPPYAAGWTGADDLMPALARHLIPKTQADTGDILLFRMKDGQPARHAAIQSATGEDAAFIHSCSGHGVVESRLTPPWARRIAARFAFPKGDI
ncbi:peptidase [Marivivens donghaensis]|uniref:Peptidase n=1 Tax=Marivivens donghaensis TaxID=1699413 RepID=A0ABX0VX66_9RHOB|nr:NlpC/P60 family protein [Marivivens donghaensis]NIY72674.1 peptidase [Marivivens donghaensis]